MPLDIFFKTKVCQYWLEDIFPKKIVILGELEGDIVRILLVQSISWDSSLIGPPKDYLLVCPNTSLIFFLELTWLKQSHHPLQSPLLQLPNQVTPFRIHLNFAYWSTPFNTSPGLAPISHLWLIRSVNISKNLRCSSCSSQANSSLLKRLNLYSSFLQCGSLQLS